MACGKDYCTGLECRRPAIDTVGGSYRNNSVPGTLNVGEPGLEMVFPAVGEDAFPDVGNQPRELVRADMRMCVNENGRVSPEIDELMEDFPVVAPLGGTGEEFSVGECTGSALSVTIIGVRIDFAPGRDAANVSLPSAYVLDEHQHHCIEPQCKEFQCGEHSGRT